MSTNDPLLFPLKSSENLRSSNVFKGYRSGTLVENGLSLFYSKDLYHFIIRYKIGLSKAWSLTPCLRWVQVWICILSQLQFSLAILYSEAVVRRCSVKKLFLEILQNSQENTCARVSLFLFSPIFCPFFLSLQWIKIDCKYCGLLRNETLLGKNERNKVLCSKKVGSSCPKVFCRKSIL